MPMLNLRLATPRHLIDINRVRDLAPLEAANDSLTMGACVRQRGVEVAPETRALVPLLAEGLAFVGHRAIRDRGTVAGSIAHADPASELPALLLLLKGEVVAEGPSGQRTIPARELFLDVFETAVASDELITSVRVPRQDPDAGWAIDEIARRRGDYALCGAAAVVGSTWARLAFFGITTIPRALDVLDVVEGRADLRERLSDIEPLGDLHASSDYRKHLAAILGERVLRRATAVRNGRTGGEGP
jgi:CO/xanthine dehydrogenase FAD-binding subunit